MPPDLPQSLYFAAEQGKVRCKLQYYFKVQLVPISVDLVNDGDGKCKVRDRMRVLVSPVEPLVAAPIENSTVPIKKRVGLRGKAASLTATIDKNFFVAGELANIDVTVDNSKCNNACRLIVSQISKVKMLHNKHVKKVKVVHKSETTELCGPNESGKQRVQFKLARSRAKTETLASFADKDFDNWHLNSMVPESVHSQTFSI